MPVQLATIALTSASTSGTVSLAAMQVSALPRSSSGPYAHLELVNESAVGLVFTFPNTTNEQWPVPAGKHRIIPIPPGESIAKWTVINAYPTAYVQQCFVFYFEFNEQVIDLGQVGAAQIGNQPRVITIALGPPTYKRRGLLLTTTPGAGQDIVLGTQNFGASGVPIIPPGDFGAGTLVIIFYLYFLFARLDVPASGTGCTADFTLFADVMNGGVTLTSTSIFEGFLLSGNVSGNAIVVGENFCAGPGAAAQDGVSGPSISSATGVQFRWHNNVLSGNPVVHWNIGATLDITNPFSPGGHGNFTLSSGTY